LLNAVAKELGDAMPFVTGAADVLDVRVAAAINSTDTVARDRVVGRLPREGR
jgi:hypothetical protein